MKIAQGAEAIISKKDGFVIKERVEKKYRIKELDLRLREKRTRLEARLLREAKRAGVMTPTITREDKFWIEMEFIDGTKLRDLLNENNFDEICQQIGENIGKLHNFGLIHGDLTTSNMIMKEGQLFFIDFGLGFRSLRVEDMATDLHVLEEALESTHFKFAKGAWKAVLMGYAMNFEGSDKVIKTLSKIEKRGRYTSER